MSLDDSLTLAEAYKLPTSHIHYLYLIQLIAQGKVRTGKETVQSLNGFEGECRWYTYDTSFCFQSEECMTLLKKLSTSEAECVIERLTSWARLQLEDKEHISDEVATSFHITRALLLQTCSNGLCVWHIQLEGLLPFHIMRSV